MLRIQWGRQSAFRQTLWNRNLSIHPNMWRRGCKKPFPLIQTEGFRRTPRLFQNKARRPWKKSMNKMKRKAFKGSEIAELATAYSV